MSRPTGDLARARQDLGYFAALIDAPLTEWQAAALTLEPRLTTIVAGRQMGKSTSLAVLALWRAFTQQGSRTLVVSAGEEASRRLLAEVRRLAARSPLLAGSLADEQSALLRLTNGSEIRSVPASERAIRGWTIDLLLVDEAQLVPDEITVGAALPTTAARPEARIVLAGSASVASGAFYDLSRRGEMGDEHVRAHRWVARVVGGEEDAPWITASAVAAAQASMSELRFAAEYRAVFGGSADVWITRPVLERVLVDRPLFALDELRGPARVAVGVDWGRRVDRSAAVAIGRVPGEAQFAVLACHRAPAGQPGTEFIREVAGSPAHFDSVVAERNGLGEGYCEALLPALRERPQESGGGRRRGGAVLLDAEAFERAARQPRSAWRKPQQQAFVTQKQLLHVSQQSKVAAYSAARILIDRVQLVIPRDAEDLIRELLLLKVELTVGGSERIEASAGHDDVADALTLALGPFQRDGRWRTRIGVLARGAVPEPNFDPRGDLAAYQSVAGPEVTAAARFNKPEPYRGGRFVITPGRQS